MKKENENLISIADSEFSDIDFKKIKFLQELKKNMIKSGSIKTILQEILDMKVEVLIELCFNNGVELNSIYKES